jgi:hypothetical protein
MNWRPRQLFPDKELTTGPVLATLISPEWIGVDGLHRSSYTTGPVIELYYGTGLPGVVVGMFALGWLMRRLVGLVSSRFRSDLRTAGFVLATYILGWNIWIDDLGGTVNKCLILAGWLAALSTVAVVARGSVRPPI